MNRLVCSRQLRTEAPLSPPPVFIHGRPQAKSDTQSGPYAPSKSRKLICSYEVSLKNTLAPELLFMQIWCNPEPDMITLLQDLRFALRQLRKSPGFTFVALVTLALAIGANALVFGVLNALILRPLNVPQAESLFVIQHGSDSGWHSYPDYLDLRRRNRSVSVPENALHFGPDTSVTSPLRCKGFRIVRCFLISLLLLNKPQPQRLWKWGNPAGISKECGKGGKPALRLSMLSTLCHFHSLLRP